jgi:soluble epoxide hydrolase/lipid-phosphate phosphatase
MIGITSIPEILVKANENRGSYLLSRMVNYYPSLFSKLVFLDIGYSHPNSSLDRNTIKFINSMVQQNMGYSVFGYFLFFDEEDAPELMNKNVCMPKLRTGDDLICIRG